jgi:voltage-gated potassium channel
MGGRLKHRLYEILEAGHPEDVASRVFDMVMVVIIIGNVAAVAMDTVESFRAQYGGALRIFELASVAIFTVEYLARLWVADQHLPLKGYGPVKARVRFALSPFPIIDFLAVAPFYLSLIVPAADLRILRVFRLLRLLKLARYSPAIASLGRVLADERRALGAALLIMVVLLMLSATAIYYTERFVQPDKFSSIPASMWWALATLTTVGYGDVVPLTALGRVIGGLVMIFGLGMFALPIGIIASGFANEIHRREFVVSWGLVARVPLFAKLDAMAVSRVSNLLRSKVVPADTVIARRGEPADAMYFIASGQVHVEIEPEPVTLGEGDFFGELALLNETTRGATVRAITQTRLLVLPVDDFHHLLNTEADLRDAIQTVADERGASANE